MKLSVALALLLSIAQKTSKAETAILTPYGVRTGPTSSSSSSPDTDGGDSTLPRPLYEFTPAHPSAPPSIVGFGGSAHVTNNDPMVMLKPCTGIEDGDEIFIQNNAYRIEKITLQHSQDVNDPRCYARMSKKWRDKENGGVGKRAVDLPYDVVAISGEGLEFAHKGGGSCSPLEGRGDCEVAGRLDVRKVVGEFGDGNMSYADLYLTGALGEIDQVVTFGEGLALFRGNSTVTVDEGNIAVEAAIGGFSAAIVRARVGDGEATSPSLRVSRGELKVLGVNDTEIIRVDENSDVFLSADTVLHFDTPSVEFGNSTLFFEETSIVADHLLLDVEDLVLHGKNMLTCTSMMDRVFFNVTDASVNRKGTKVDHEGSFLLTSNALLNVSAVEGVAVYSNSGVSMKSMGFVEIDGGAGGVDVGGGVLKIAGGELAAGGLTVNEGATVLSGTKKRPLLVEGEKFEVGMNNEDGAIFRNEQSSKSGGRVHVATGRRVGGKGSKTSPLVELVQGGGGDVVLSLVSDNATSALVTFGTPSLAKPVSGSLEFHYGGEAHVKKGGLGGSGQHFSVNIDGKERTRVTAEGYFGVGEFLSSGQLRAPIHVRHSEFVPKIKWEAKSTGILLEGFQNTLALSGQSQGKHVNGLVFGTSPVHSGSPDYWIMSQRGLHDGRFGKNSFVIGHSDDSVDVVGDGLDELTEFEVAISLGENGGVCIGCEVAMGSSKLVVGGGVDASEYLLVSDQTFLKKAESLLAERAELRAALVGMNVRICEWGGESAKSKGLPKGKEYCLVAQDVGVLDRLLVKSGAGSEKLIKLNGLVMTLVGAVGDMDEQLVKTAESVKDLEGRVNALEEEMGEIIIESKEAEAREKEVEKRVKEVEGCGVRLGEVVEGLKGELELGKVQYEGTKGLVEGLGEQIEGFTSLIGVMSERIKELEKKVEQKEDPEKLKKKKVVLMLEEDEEFFLSEVHR
ncbi:hypothetical protein TrLO_g1568 [Triparma laevis f. longispina]|nr:hypothetical protein TrLO_g1568 [Triparma laevis f. longispina]